MTPPRSRPFALAISLALVSLAALGALGACSGVQDAQSSASDPVGPATAPRDEGGHGHGHRHRHHHSFSDAAQWSEVFESADRDAWQKGEAVVAALGLRGDERMADIGAATGYFPVRFAVALPKGRIYAIDVEPGMVAWLKRRAEEERLGQIKAVLAQPDNPMIPEPVDLVFVCNTYHHIGNRTAYFERVRQLIKPGGRLVIVDFKKEPTPFGPPLEMRIAPDAIAAELEAAGYQLKRREDTLLPYQHLLIFEVASQPVAP